MQAMNNNEETKPASQRVAAAVLLGAFVAGQAAVSLWEASRARKSNSNEAVTSLETSEALNQLQMPAER